MPISISTHNKYAWLLFAGAFLFLFGLIIITPYQAIDPDSVNGFKALQGWKTLGKFNSIVKPEQSNISVLHSQFLTWWTPGQYLFPYYTGRIFHMSNGKAVTLLNFISMFGGLIGFYRLFRIFLLPEKVIRLSIVLILFSHTVLFRFILYQGGETYSFFFFPWLIIFFYQTKNKIVRAALVLPLLVIGFIAKSQMLIALIPLFLLIPISEAVPKKWDIKNRKIILRGIIPELLLLSLGIFTSLFLIYVFFLSKGKSPASLGNFHPSLLDTFFPLASPITSLANGWNLILRIGEKHPVLQIIMLMFSTGIVILVFIFFKPKNHYYRLVLFYFITICLAFVFLFYFDAHIDYDVRHQKFLGYLFFPLLITLLIERLSFRLVAICVVSLCLYSTWNHIRLTKIWFNDSYKTRSEFRIQEKEFPEQVYKILDSEKSAGTTLFFSPYSTKWAVDVPEVICVDSNRNTVFYGHTYPVWYVNRESQDWKSEMRKKFPDYKMYTHQQIGDFMFIKLK